jgi:hypothetical protein
VPAHRIVAKPLAGLALADPAKHSKTRHRIARHRPTRDDAPAAGGLKATSGASFA